ncbi:hypothetical protein MSUIS_05500 [Mycoplasma suis KI3806]|uniref:Uncharacterized protein n=1 Tax=Mycoplasma suis (strain KI_3806) TaxID=708248 RepID=F0V1W2_MYCS3|nr:hypothetical protein [Mycoplasma suis]CBZ40643.1 hypothetical protein MSUIS_05500 [Mycoplasma suis KI3806]
MLFETSFRDHLLGGGHFTLNHQNKRNLKNKFSSAFAEEISSKTKQNDLTNRKLRGILNPSLKN